MNYRLVQQLQKKAIPAVQICRVLGVSPSGFYAAQHRQQRPATSCATSIHLKAAFAASDKPCRIIVVTTTNLPSPSLLKPFAQFLHTLTLERAVVDEEPKMKL